MVFSLPDQFVELPPGPVEDPFLKESIEAIQRNLQALAGQQSGGGPNAPLLVVGAGGQRKTNFSGLSVITWNGTALSDSLVVTHHLGAVPEVILLRLNDIGQMVHLFATAKSTTDFTVQARAAGGVGVSTTPFDWLVAG